MAELALAILGLSGLFRTCMECFEYVELGRSFGKDYDTCLLRLDVAKLRLSRWGESMGLGQNFAQRESLRVPARAYRTAEELLNQIQNRFETTEAISTRYKSKTIADGGACSAALQICNPTTDLDVHSRQAHSVMQGLTSARKRSHANLLQKTRWALYEKKKFDSMIEELSCFIKELVELFPGQLEVQRQLGRNEIDSIQSQNALAPLAAVCEEDPILRHALMERDRGGNFGVDYNIGGYAKVTMGDRYANSNAPQGRSNQLRGVVITDFAELHVGSEYGTR